MKEQLIEIGYMLVAIIPFGIVLFGLLFICLIT
jgi:hypothetical protein